MQPDRRMQLERLEDRRMLAVGLRLLGIQPNGDVLLNEGDVRHRAPTDLRFLFTDGQVIDDTTLDGIQIRRSLDGVFDNEPNEVITPGFVGLGDTSHDVVVRFSTSLPDDLYRVDIFGSGPNALRNEDGEPFNDGQDLQFHFELDLGPQVLAVVPQPVTQVGQVRTQARDQIDVYFNNDRLLESSAENTAFYQLQFTRDTVTNLDDAHFAPNTAVYDAGQNKVTLTFDADLDQLIDPATLGPIGSGTFRLRIGTNETSPAAPEIVNPEISTTSDFNTGNLVAIKFTADVLSAEGFGTAPTVVVTEAPRGAAGPGVTVADNVVSIELNSDAANPSTARQVVDAINDPANGATGLLTASIDSGDDTTVLAGRNLDFSPLTLTGLGSSFETATDLSVLGDQSKLISSRIDPQGYPLDFPGGNDDLGHRDIPVEVGGHFDQHINPDFGADHLAGVTTILYNFRPDYGFDPQGNALVNVITEQQKQRAREAVEVWGNYIGVQFLETSNQGLTIATGDALALDPDDPNVLNHTLNEPEVDAGFIVRVDPDFANGLLILDAQRNWSDVFGGDWFETAMIGIGAMLGLERANDLPPATLMAFASQFVYPGTTGDSEPIFPGNHDIAHGRHVHRPDSNDVDLFRFELQQRGRLTTETFAERQANSSLLDPVISLFREDATGARRLIARNDDYFSEDAFVELTLDPGVYFVGVSSSGNEDYNAEYQNAGFGGTSQGQYDLRLAFRPELQDGAIRDDDNGQPGVVLDGDADGQPGGVYNYWFRSQTTDADSANNHTIFVDKLSTGARLGTLGAPFDNLGVALAAAQPGDIVRVLGNGGFDGNRATLGDNFAYEIGFGTLPNQTLTDGTTLNVPKGVTVMIDAGAILKLHRARVGVGSSSLGVDRSQGALQVLGTPLEPVHFTSFLDETTGLDTHSPRTTPAEGDWGGVVFRNDLDNAEQRFNYENAGIFLNVVNQANISYGGGNVVIDSIQQIVTPIQMVESRPTIGYNTIQQSADAAMSADPDSFEETNFHAPRFQLPGLFTSDFTRIGPDIRGNLLIDNSTNALFVRISTPAGNVLRSLSVPGRFDDTDVVHVIAENLRILGQPGEPILELARPPVELVTLKPLATGTLPAATYAYKVVFIDGNGFEGRPSRATSPVVVGAGQGAVELNGLPPATGAFVARHIYRSQPGGAGPFNFVARLDRSDATFVDDGSVTGSVLQRDPPPAAQVVLTPQAGGGTLAAGEYNYRIVFVDAEGNEGPSSDPTANVVVAAGDDSVRLDGVPAVPAAFAAARVYRSDDGGLAPYRLVGTYDPGDAFFIDDGTTGDALDPTLFGVVRARTDGRLRVDPGTVVKLEGSRIETTFGAQFIAEGTAGREVIFTSKLDDRYGAGGTFDTNNDLDQDQPTPGDWGGLFVGHLGKASVDHSLLTYGGGITKVEGTFAGFNVLEIHQADVRVAHSVIENNADGIGGQSPPDRFGRGEHDPAAIFVRGAQPVLLDNIIRDNEGPAVSINANALTSELVPDPGRTTGLIDRTRRFRGNQGPLIGLNRIDNNPINGMIVRADVLDTQAVWDDTSIVHVLFDEIIVPDFHTFGGLRLESSPSQSLVVKLSGPGDNFTSTVGAGFTALGRQLDITDRIGGSIQIIGEPDFPVILTSLADDDVGAGLTSDNESQRDTNNDGDATVPLPGDWRSVRLQEFSNDRNVETILESELPTGTAPGDNASPDTAQFLGELAPFEQGGDDNLRLGFEIHGLLNARQDVDVYSFNGTAGTEVWLDVDRTSATLDTVVELIDADGVVIARSDNSLDETLDPSKLFRSGAIPDEQINPLQKLDPEYQPRHASDIAKDFYSTNILDAGMRVVLPGVVGTRSSYHLRVRSSSDDLSELFGGQTSGAYQLQIRLQEQDEAPGSTVRYSEVRYATNGVELVGVPYHSPLVGEVGEDEEEGGPESNSHIPPNPFVPASGPQDLGNLLRSDRGTLSIAGSISVLNDLDFYEFRVDYEETSDTEHQHVASVFDVDYADGLSRANTIVSLFDRFGRLLLIGRDSNIADDRQAPLADGNLSDLARGSLGPLDPFVGPVEIPEDTYFATVSSNARIPQELLVNPFVRLEPINSVVRVVEDHLGGPDSGATATPALDTSILDESSVIPETVDDLTFFVSRQNADPDRSSLVAVDPITGRVEARLGDLLTGNTEFRTLDIATRIDDGTLFGLSAPVASTDPLSGLFLDINTRTAMVAANPLDDGIETYEEDPANPGSAIPSDVGIVFNATTFGMLDGEHRMFGVGDRGDAFNAALPLGPTDFRNLLYQFDPQTGEAFSAPDPDRQADERFQDAGTQIRERGVLDPTVGGGPDANITGLAIVDDTLFAVSDSARLFRVDDPTTSSASLTLLRDFGIVVPEVEPNNSFATAQSVEDEYFHLGFNADIGDLGMNTSQLFPHLTIAGTGDGSVDGFTFLAPQGGSRIVADIDGASFDTELFLFDSAGNLLASNDDNTLGGGAGGEVNVLDAFVQFDVADPGTYHVVVGGRDLAKTAIPVPGGGIYTLHLSVQNHDAAFSGLAARSRFDGAADPFNSTLVAIGTGGKITAIDVADPTTPLEKPIFDGGAVRVETGIFNANGLAISQPNLWHLTDIRADDFGHGINPVFDNSRGNASRVTEHEPNDTPATAHDLEKEFWSLGFNSNIGDATMNTSMTIPHVTIDGSGDGTFDYYSFRVEIPPDDLDGIVTGIFDIDIDFDELNDPTGSMDAELYLFDEAGNQLAASLDASPALGALGSTTVVDPFIQFPFTQDGTYTILVARTIPPFGQPPQPGDFYTLQVSLEEHRVDGMAINGGQSFYFGHERGDYDDYQRAHGSIVSDSFSLVGYAAEDRPVLYFNYFLDIDDLDDQFRVFMVEGSGTETPLAIERVDLEHDAVWRQARIPLDAFAGKDNLSLKFFFDTQNDVDNDVFEGAFIDDLIVGFVERGEMVTAATNNPNFSINPDAPANEILTGEYQLEIRRGTDFGTSQVPLIGENGLPSTRPNSVELTHVFDTNDRHVAQVTLLAPAGATLTDGQTFALGDGISSLTFEYDNDNSVLEGNVRVPFLPGQSAATVARSIRDAINGTPAQAVLEITAASSDGRTTGPFGNSERVNLFGNAIVDESEIDVIRFDETGDRNLFRDQGQILVNSNFIVDSRDYGVVAEGGQRDIERDDVPVGFLEAHPGSVRKLRELNISPDGGQIPGAVIENNVFVGEGLGGVYFGGNLAPYELVALRPLAFPNQFSQGATSGDRYCDGDTIDITVGRQTVRFEFEDLGGSTRNQPCPGSGNLGGNGWTPGNHPIFYRKSGGGYLNRQLGYSQFEMAVAIHDAINSSILTTNGTTQTARATVFNSRALAHPLTPGPDPAVFIEHAVGVFHTGTGQDCEVSVPRCKFEPPTGRRVPIQAAPQPFGRLLNNTIFGNDGDQSFFPGSALLESNDTVNTAVRTHQGRATNPQTFVEQAMIGDSIDFNSDVSLDVDIFEIRMGVRDRLVVDIDARGDVVEVEPNDDPLTPMDLEAELWNLNFDLNIGDQVQNTSTQTPHITILGTGDGTFDYYSFVVNQGNTRGIFDIDFGDEFGLPGSGSFDSMLFLFDAAGNLLDFNDDALAITDGAAGSISLADAYLEFDFQTPGTYILGVGKFPSLGGPGGITGTPLDPGDTYTLQISVENHVTANIGLDSLVRVFDSRGFEVASNDDGIAPGENPSEDSYVEFSAAAEGTYYVAVSGSGNDVYDPLSLGERMGPVSTGDYRISIDVQARRTWVITAVDGTLVTDGTTFQVSDVNTTVTYEFDDVRTPGVAPGNIPVVYDGTPVPMNGARGPGYRPPEMAVAIARTIGTGLEGVTAVALGGEAGATANGPSRDFAIFPDTVPFGVVGFGHNLPGTVPRSSGELYVVVDGASRITGGVDFRPMLDENVDQLLPETGILVAERAAPTVLNNALSNLESGVIQVSSGATVVGGSIYQHSHTQDSNVGASGSDFNITLGPNEPFFVSTAGRNFYPAPFARSIDSAIDSLEERPTLGSVKNAMGIPVSPILAPDLDGNGILRADDPDVATPSGLGANVFKDRGALDRADFVGPDAVLIDPQDNDADMIDIDPTPTVVQLSEGDLRVFSVQLVDGSVNGGQGVGVDDNTVTADKVTLTEDGRLLEEGVDYRFRYNATTNVISLTPASGFWPNDKTYVITLNNADRFVIDIPDGGAFTDGVTFFVTDQASASVTFEFESGYSIQVPETLTLQVPAIGIGPGGILDGQRFVVNNGGGVFTTFEFDSNVPPNILPGNRRVDISSAASVDDIADAMVDALQAASIGVTALNLGGGRVHIGAPASFSVDTTLSNLTQTGETGVVADGQTFTVTNGLNPTVGFEFDSDGVFIDANFDGLPDNVLIQFSVVSTQDEIAQAIADAIDGAGVGLDATNFGEGHVHLGGSLDHVVDTTDSPKLALIGAPGVQPSTTLRVPAAGPGPGGIADGQFFRISNGTITETFEFDRNGQLTQPGARAVLFTVNSSVDQIADSMVAAIQLTNIGVNPVNLGQGRVQLNDTAKHSSDVTQTALTRSGVPGGAVPINFLPDSTFTADQLTQVLLGEIRNSDLSNVFVTLRGGFTYFVEGAKAISGFPSFFVSAIEDAAGNDLRPNQQTNVTQFVIIMPEVELDFSDAPDIGYPTLFEDDGARHTLPSSGGFFLGAGVESDADGQPDPNAAADDDDGVTFGTVLNAFLQTPISVVASSASLLDAWIDFNRDGDWDDPGEQIFQSEPLQAGTNELSTGTPAFAQAGTTFARFRISSAGGLRPIGVATDGEVEDYAVTIVPGQPPVANDDAYATDEDTVLDVPSLGVLANDDPEAKRNNGDLKVIRFDDTSALGATVSVNADGSFTYDPNTSTALQALVPGTDLTDTFTYRIDDGLLPSNDATVSILVSGLNDRPVAVDDAYTTDEDTQLNLPAPGVLENDFDPDAGDSFSVVDFDGTSTLGGTVTVNANGSFTYDPLSSSVLQGMKPGESMTDTFTYTIQDVTGGTDVGTVSVTVDGLNDDPDAVDDNYAGDEDNVLSHTAATGVLANDSDIDGDNVSVSGHDNNSSQGAVVTVNADGSFTYDPTAAPNLQALPQGGSTNDTFTYSITDGNGGSDSATVTIAVDGQNDNPIGVDDSYATDQDQVLNVTQPAQGVLANDRDVDANDTIAVGSFDAVSDKGATVSMNADGTFTYDPTAAADLQAIPPDQKEIDTFTYEVEDSFGATDTVTVSVEVTGVNAPPDAVDDNFVTDEDTILNEPAPGVLGNDTNPDGPPPVVIDFDDTSTLGAPVQVAADGSFTYDPTGVAALQALNVGQSVADSFTYTIRDDQNATDAATVTVRVDGVNDKPVAVDDTVTVRQNVTTNIDVASNDTDVDGTVDATTVSVKSGPSNGSVTVNPNGTLAYTPDTDFNGADSITYTVMDNSGAESDEATVNINVNNPPVANDDQFQVFKNVTSTLDVLSNDTDIDGTIDTSSVLLVDLPTNGTATVNADGTVDYEPATDFLGQDSFTYTVADDDGSRSLPATVSLNVVEDPFPHQNPRNSLDVNADGVISPIDALLVINDLNRNGARDLPNPPTPPDVPPPFLDTSGDNRVEAIDALLVINFLNAQGGGEGEGEGGSLVAPVSGSSLELVGLLSTGNSAAPVTGDAEQEADAKADDSNDSDLPIGDEERDEALAELSGRRLSRLELDDALADIADDVADALAEDLLEDEVLFELLGDPRRGR